MCAVYRTPGARLFIIGSVIKRLVITVLVPDWLYSRIPHIWLCIGLLFLLIGFAAGPDFRLFYAYLLLGLVCLLRALYIYQARHRFHRRNKVAFLHETQVIHRNRK